MRLRAVIYALALGALIAAPAGGLPADKAKDPASPTAAPASGFAAACHRERIDLRERLDRVWEKKQRNGDIAFAGADSVLYRHPLLATLALEAFRATGDYAFLQKSHDVLKGYFSYLLLYHDADRDFLVERASTPDPAWPADVEDIGFNAMLALDMSSLSRICVELKMPLDALYWYHGMRTVSTRLVRASFDPGVFGFLPTRATSPQRQSLVSGLSVLPACFSSEIGTENTLRLLRTHALQGDATAPGSPARYLSPATPEPGRPEEPTERLVRSLLLLGALESNGLVHESLERAEALASASSSRPGERETTHALDEIGRYAQCVIRTSGPFAPFPHHPELAVLDQLVFQKALLEPGKTAALRKSIAAIETYLSARSAAEGVVDMTESETVKSSVREVYFAVSLLRDRWKQRSLFSKSDLSEIPGFDVHAAASELWDDVVETLREAETRATRDEWRAEGFDVTASIENFSLAPGEPAPVLFRISSAATDVSVAKFIVYHPQGADTLWSGPSPFAVPAGAPPREFPYAYALSRNRESAIVPVVCSAEVRFADGRRARYHFRLGASITLPVRCAVAFPRGATLNGGTVPIEIAVEKRIPRGTSIQVQWYSPVGLKPVEGRSLEAWMPEQTPEATLTLNVPVPTPCRPGSFPFSLTVFANGEEIGRVSSSLFRHYQWLFVGPFPGRRDAMETRYPPESRTDPLDTYTAALGELSWQTLPLAAYGDDGKIALGTLLPDGSVGFLYTVIETSASRASAVIFECDAPAVLFVNGEAVARSNGGASTRQRARVTLRGGPNNVLVKTLSTGHPVVFFQLGDEEDLMSDEFNNNLWELVDGYEELLNRGTVRDTVADRVQRQVTITYRDPRATSVSVVGNFNGWSPANSVMRKNKYGEWEVNLYLSPGRYTYRLLVDNATEVLDPVSPYTEPDGYGGQNSVLYVQ